jgi:hypothetical protein
MAANLENIRLTYDMLQQAACEKRPFTLHVWKSPMRFVGLDRIIVHGDHSHSCGFAACVGGLMMTDPMHNARGLVESSDHDIESMPLFEGHRGGLALARFWGVTVPEAESVYASNSYPNRNPTIEEAAGRLHGLINNC